MRKFIGKMATPEWAPRSSTGLNPYRKNSSVWTRCLGKCPWEQMHLEGDVLHASPVSSWFSLQFVGVDVAKFRALAVQLWSCCWCSACWAWFGCARVMLSVASMMVVFVLKLCLATDVVFEFGYVDRSVDCWIMQVVFVGFRMLLIGFRALVEFVRLVARSARPLIVAAFCFCFGSFLLRPFTVCFYRKVSQRLAEGPPARKYRFMSDFTTSSAKPFSRSL